MSGLNAEKVEFHLKVKDKVISAIDFLLLPAQKVKGVSGFLAVGLLVGLVSLMPLYSAFSQFRQIKNQYESAYADYQEKKNLILSSIRKLQKAKPLKMPTQIEFYRLIYGELLSCGIDVSRLAIRKTSMSIKTLQYPAVEADFTGRVYGDESIKNLLLFSDNGWFKLVSLNVSKGTIKGAIAGAVEEEKWNSRRQRRF